MASALIVVAVALAFAAAVALLLLRRGSERRERIAVAVVLAAALAGYAATGRPGLPAAPPPALRGDFASVSAFEAERQRRLPRFGDSAAWLTFADAMIRADAAEGAVRGLRDAIDRRPRDATLWIGLGHALAAHAGRVGIASRLAYARAAALDPGDSPAFFLGLDRLTSGDARGARATWEALKARSLPDPRLDRWIAVAEQRAAGQP